MQVKRRIYDEPRLVTLFFCVRRFLIAVKLGRFVFALGQKLPGFSLNMNKTIKSFKFQAERFLKFATGI